MPIGLIIAARGHGTEPNWLDSIAKLSVIVGLTLSVGEFGGIKHVSQFLELGMSAGYLMGTHMTAKDNAQGYPRLMLGNVSCASLMGMEGFYILMTRQLVFLGWVTDAFFVRRNKRTIDAGTLIEAS